MEEQEEERYVNAFGRQAVSVAAAVWLPQWVVFQLAEVVAELVELAALGGELEGGEDCLVDLFGRPAADGTAVLQENLQQPDDPGVMKFDAGITDCADGDGQSDPLQQGKVHMNVAALGLEAGEAISDDLEPFADGVEMIESFLQCEVAQVVGAELMAEETREFLIRLQECVFPVGSEKRCRFCTSHSAFASVPVL